MTIHKAKASDYASVTSENVIMYIFSYSSKINMALGDFNKGRLFGKNKTQLNAIAAELETVCKRLDYILEGRY